MCVCIYIYIYILFLPWFQISMAANRAWTLFLVLSAAYAFDTLIVHRRKASKVYVKLRPCLPLMSIK